MSERAELIGANVQYLNKPENSGAMLEIVIPINKIEEAIIETAKDKMTV